MNNGRMAATLEEALEQPIVILKTATGFYDYANIYLEYDMIQGKDVVVAFFRNANDVEEHFDPADYGKKWECIVFDLPNIDKDLIMLN